MDSGSNEAKRAFGGLLRRRECWVLTWPARLSLALILIGGGVFMMRSAHAFLALNAPVETGVIVVEGWMSHYDMTNYVAHCEKCTMIYTTGGPTHMARNSRDVSDTYASIAYWNLRRTGIPAEKLQMVPAGAARRDRTYTSAVALRDWCRLNNTPLTTFNVLTVGPHARRSRLIYEKAFGPEVQIGTIALTNGDYDPAHWWRYSEGVKETLSESFAYLYARFLFSPE